MNAVDIPADLRIVVHRATEPGVSRKLRPGEPDMPGRYTTWVHETGAWIAHCRLCKDRVQFVTQQAALDYARDGHRTRPAHQRWVGRLSLALDLPDIRGYDSPSSLQSRSGSQVLRCEYTGSDLWRIAEGQGAEVEAEHARRRQARTAARQADELAQRRAAVPAPQIRWTLGPALGPADVTWSNGTRSTGTFYDLKANGRYVAHIVALQEGGWLFNGQYMPDDSTLIRAAS